MKKIKPLFKIEKSPKEKLLEKLRKKKDESGNLITNTVETKKTVKVKKTKVDKKKTKSKTKKQPKVKKTVKEVKEESKDKLSAIEYVDKNTPTVKVLSNDKSILKIEDLYNASKKKKSPKQLMREQLKGKTLQKYYLSIDEENEQSVFVKIGKLVEEKTLKYAFYATGLFNYEIYT